MPAGTSRRSERYSVANKVIFPLFCKKGTTHKISILQEKQESGSVLHMANALRGKISPTHLGYS
jgi:hypothetical protein